MVRHLKVISGNSSPPQEKSSADPDLHEALPLHAQARLGPRSALAIALVVLALWIANDFLPALIWAGIFAITPWPLYERFAAKFTGGTTSIGVAFLFTIFIGVSIFLPIALATYQLAQ